MILSGYRRSRKTVSVSGLILAILFLSSAPAAEKKRPVPLIYDTDIGGDMDDTWTLALILASPEVRPLLIVTDSANTEGKAKIVARFLERADRTDIPVGIGVKTSDYIGNQQDWVKDYDLSRYPGKVHKDGVKALIDTVMKSPEKLTILAVGPVTNLAEALRREPRITQHARLVVMGGCIEKASIRAPKKRVAESNVRHDPQAARAAYGAAWDVTMAPLDTAGGILLAGKLYARVRDSESPLCRALLENYRIWGPKVNWDHAEEHSSGLFDPVAFSLIVRPQFLRLEDMRLKVTEKGMTVPDPEGKLIHVAIRWKDLGGFFRFISDRLSAPYKPLRPKSSKAGPKRR